LLVNENFLSAAPLIHGKVLKLRFRGGRIYKMLRSTLRISSLLLACFCFLAGIGFSQVTFPGSGVGPIPDGPSTSCPTAGSPLDVTFNVTGISGPPSNISVSMTFSPAHTWAGDVRAVLIAPNGTNFVIFGQTGLTTATGFGDSSDLAGPYSFNDAATGNWWAEAQARTGSEALTAGSYRTSQLGGSGSTGAVTNLNPAFASIPTSNGTWTLRFTDHCSGDTGTVSAASLTLTPGVTPKAKNVDFNGDGKSDFVIGRAVTVPFAPGSENRLRFESVRERLKYDTEHPVDLLSPNANVIDWWIATQTTFNVNVWRFGNADTDFLTPGDFDGDLKADVAVWRPGAPGSAQYIVLRSSDLTVQTFNFGQTGDDPTLVGDYDGDGKADPAVFRCPPGPGPAGQCYFFYLDRVANPSGVVTYVPWGYGTNFDLFAAPGDYDGDGKNDFCFQTTHPNFPGQGLFVLLRSSDLAAEYIPWGLNNDFIIPGDYDGDGKSDFCVRRTVSGTHRYYILTRTGGGTGASYIQFGLTGDQSVPGDYDGDGKTDIATYRPGSGGNNGTFWIAPSGGGAVQLFPWGIAGDYPVANWQVH